MPKESEGEPRSITTLNLSTEGAVLFAEISAPPMNLLGPQLVRDIVSLVRLAMKHGLQTRDAEMDLGAMLGGLGAENPDPPDRSTAVLTGEAT